MPSERELIELTRKLLTGLGQTCSLSEQTMFICQEIQRLAPDTLAFVLGVDGDGLLHALPGDRLPIPAQPLVGLPACALPGIPARSIPPQEPPASSPAPGLWAAPIQLDEEHVLAVLILQPRETPAPTVWQRCLVEICVPLLSLVVEREQNRARIERLAFHDGLTGLPNRHLLLSRIGQVIAQRHDGGASAVMIIGLERFKRIKHALGSSCADELLVLVARRLKEELRIDDSLARVAPDEFALLLPNCTSEQAGIRARRVLKALGKPFAVAGASLHLSGRLGISLHPEDAQTAEALVNCADMAMQHARSCARDSYCYYSKELQSTTIEDFPLEEALRTDIEEGRLELHYQPQVRLDDGRLCGVEALVRWRHPQLGNISPSRFITLAERCGLIDPLGYWVLNEACRQFSDWRRRELEIPSISVNLSPSNLHDPQLPTVIAQSLAQHDVHPAELVLEITESAPLDSSPLLLKTIQEIHSLGIRLSMDDFGTGFSNLSHLHHLPVGEIKLDRSFVLGLENDGICKILSGEILRLGESLQLAVVAEGVETEGQRRILVQLGYQVGQGYLFSPALPAARLEAWIAARNA